MTMPFGRCSSTEVMECVSSIIEAAGFNINLLVDEVGGLES